MHLDTSEATPHGARSDEVWGLGFGGRLCLRDMIGTIFGSVSEQTSDIASCSHESVQLTLLGVVPVCVAAALRCLIAMDSCKSG